MAIAQALRGARSLLREYGYPCDVSVGDFVRWLHTDTPYPNPSFDEIVSNRYYVVHELVEIGEVRRMGLRITKDVITRHMLEVDRAHERAAEAEFAVARNCGARDHLRMRLEHVRAWSKDPTLPPSRRRRYARLCKKVERLLADVDEA